MFLKIRLITHKTKGLNQFYINIGPVFSFGTSKTFETSGIFTYEGYYPEYHVVLSDIPVYGFYNDKGFSTKPESNLQSFSIAALIEAGINIPLVGEKLNVNLSILYQKGLLNLSSDDDNYIFTENPDNYNPLIDSRAKVSTSFFGLNVGILYKLF